MHNEITRGAGLAPLTRRMLDVSTAMVPKATGLALQAGAGPLFDAIACVPFFTEGWIVFVPPIGHDGQNQEIAELGHPEFADLLRFARTNGFDYLKLDVDGGVVVGLPTFDW